eukprot:scaffold16964_cov77-Skeletonema_dohrnii-CCMP3373.AAC.2
MEQYDNSEHLTYDELALIAGDVIDADYNNFDDETKARCHTTKSKARRDVDGTSQRRSSGADIIPGNVADVDYDNNFDDESKAR